MRGRNIAKVQNLVGVAALVAAVSLAYLAKQVSTAVEAGVTGYSSGSVVTEEDGYFVVTLGKVPLIFSTDFIPG